MRYPHLLIVISPLIGEVARKAVSEVIGDRELHPHDKLGALGSVHVAVPALRG